MRSHSLKPAWAGIALALMLAVTAAVGDLVAVSGSSRLPTQAPSKLEATIFSYDGHDFVRTHTTLVTEAGKSAVNTKLDRNTPAFQALVEKHSFTGDATVFGKHYDASYAPLTDGGGKVIGALFVAIPK
jgi:hypothetical protein